MSPDQMNELRGTAFADAYVEAVREELNKNKGQWKRLADTSGGRLSYPWINSFASGVIANCHISTIAECGKYLGLQLRVAPGPHFNKFEA